MNECARALRESVPVEDMQMLYTCAVDDVQHMQVTPQPYTLGGKPKH